MFILMLIVFVVGYMAIALEHNIRVDKSASALLIGTITWSIYVMGAPQILNVDTSLSIKELLESGTHFLKSLKEYFIFNFEADKEETYSLLNHFVLEELQHHLIEIYTSHSQSK